MDPNAAVEVPPPSDAPPKSRTPLVAAVVAVGAIAVALAFWQHNRQSRREQDAADSLNKLGAIVVKDAAQKHVASVNLSTLEDPEKLAAAIEQLPALTYTTALDASRTPISDEQLAAVGQLTNLQSLTLNSTAVADAGLAHLRGLSSLQALYLAETNVTDAGVDALGALANLHILDLSASKVTGNLEPLAKLSELEWLLLRELTLKDDALPALTPIQSLTHLSLEGAKYSEDSLATFQNAVAGAKCDR